MRKWTMGLGAAVLVILAGCGGGKAPAAPAAGGPAAATDVKLGEFFFNPKDVVVRAGDVVLAIKNEGSTEHNFVIEAAGKKVAEIPVLGAGKADNLKVKLEPGTYTMVCTYPGHKDGGMVGTLKVQ